VQAATLREALAAGGVAGAEIQQFGSARDYVIRARLSEDAGEGETEAVAQAVGAALDARLGAGQYIIERTEAVGPKVGRELQEKALIAILFSFVTTLVYLAFRFEWRFGVAAVLATAHDILATVAFVRYLNLEVSLVVVAAVLTVVGYSLNDTIVIFDRVRENLRKYRRSDLYGILNLSVNETLPRTILTGGTTLVTALTLAFLAGAVIQPFALVLAFGIVIGTFSSIYIASPILLWIEGRWPGTDARGARVLRVGAGTGTAPAAARPGEAHPKTTG
jgi:preprotein translocase subunit SecF